MSAGQNSTLFGVRRLVAAFSVEWGSLSKAGDKSPHSKESSKNACIGYNLIAGLDTTYQVCLSWTTAH